MNISEEPIREDALPEGSAYLVGGMDDGCEVSLSCLSCPLPLCKFDDPNYVSPELALEHSAREETIIKLTEQGMSARAISNKMGKGYSKRTVQRIRVKLNMNTRVLNALNYQMKPTCKRGHKRIAGVKKCRDCAKIYYERRKKAKR